MISLIDTHTHIDLPVFDEDREVILGRAADAGVHAIVVIGHNRERWRTTRALCDAHRMLARTVGLHPNDAGDWSTALLHELREELNSGEPIAIGETGLDFYRDSAPARLQREAFTVQIGLAKEYDLPLVIHQRAAEPEILEMLRAHQPVRGVMHCFSGDAAYARECLDLGFVLGIGGVVTYPKSEAIRSAVAKTPLESIVLETDAPFLAPQRWRGSRNEPAFVGSVAETIASLHGVSIEAVAERTTKTAVRVFGPRVEMNRQRGLEPI